MMLWSSLQLCVNVQIPTSSGGLGGAALYIDTERCFRIKRLEEIAEAAVYQLNDEDFTLESILDGFHYIEVATSTELDLLVTHRLQQFIDQHPQVSWPYMASQRYTIRH